MSLSIYTYLPALTPSQINCQRLLSSREWWALLCCTVQIVDDLQSRNEVTEYARLSADCTRHSRQLLGVLDEAGNDIAAVGVVRAVKRSGKNGGL